MRRYHWDDGLLGLFQHSLGGGAPSLDSRQETWTCQEIHPFPIVPENRISYLKPELSHYLLCIR